MKTTLELPDELMRAIKLRAVREDRKLKDLIAELLRQGLAAKESTVPGKGHRVNLPLIRTAHPAAKADELTPDRVFEILMEDEVRAVDNR
jgi:hypothetical protein